MFGSVMHYYNHITFASTFHPPIHPFKLELDSSRRSSRGGVHPEKY